MTSYIMDLTQLRQFGIITYPKVDFSFIIYYLTYLIFLIKLLNQLFQSTYIKLVVFILAYGILLSQMYIYKKVYLYLLDTYNSSDLTSYKLLTC